MTALCIKRPGERSGSELFFLFLFVVVCLFLRFNSFELDNAIEKQSGLGAAAAFTGVYKSQISQSSLGSLPRGAWDGSSFAPLAGSVAAEAKMIRRPTRSIISTACLLLRTLSLTPVSRSDRTLVPIVPHNIKIAHDSHCLFLGSCFGEAMAEELHARKFLNIVSNPQGTLYNAMSISTCIHNLINARVWNDQDLFLDHDIYRCFEFSGTFASVSHMDMLARMNEDRRLASDSLRNASLCFVTLGTSKVFETNKHSRDEQKRVVVNCLKQPPSKFTSRMLSVQEQVECLSNTLSMLQAFNPQVQIVLTVSPVRHVKEGLVENTKSKAALILTAHELVRSFPSLVSYFPSYELMLDELRDYRYYRDDDLVHPSDLARSYIFYKFAQCFFSAKTLDLCAKLKQIQSNVRHRVGSGLVASNEYQAHLQQTLRLIQALESQVSIDLSVEKKDILAKLISR